MRLILKGTKVAADGEFLYLVHDQKGEKYLLEPLNLTLSSKDRMYIDLLRELRKTIQKPINTKSKLRFISYQGLEKFKNDTCLILPYEEMVWKSWQRKGLRIYSPQEVVRAAEAMISFVDDVKVGDIDFKGFFPGDLLPFTDGEWGILDPRVQNILAPYRKGEVDREFYSPPEVIAGEPWSEQSYLYTMGLSLYTLATGVFPFPLENRRETVTAILKEEPIDPRYHQAEIGEALAMMILQTIKKKTTFRPELDYLEKECERIIETGSYNANPEEEIKFKEEAAQVKKKAEQRRKRYWHWQKTKWPLAIATAIIVFAILLSRGGYEEQITPETKPQEVVALFYEGLANLDTMQLEEPLAKGVGKEFINMVAFAHVTSKMRQAYEFLNIPFLTLDGLMINEDEYWTEETPVYLAKYQLQILEGEEYLIQERQDWLTLNRIKKEWRISELQSQVLDEKRVPSFTEDSPEALDR